MDVNFLNGNHMRRITFLEKTKELALYTERYDTVQLFEMTQLYGPQVSGALIFLLSLPFLIFSTQWVCLPFSFLIISLGSLFFFELRLWMPDFLKGVAMPSKDLQLVLNAISNGIEKVQAQIPSSSFFKDHETLFARISSLVMIVAAFQLGFIQSPHTSYWTVFTLLFLSFDVLVNVGYFTFFGYLFFAIGLL